MDIERLHADDRDTLRQVVTLTNAVREVDCPWVHPTTETNLVNEVTHGWDGEPDTHYVARQDGELVGHASYFAPGWDNPELAWLRVLVAPERRGRGHGGRALDHLVEEVTGAGRTKLGCDVWDGSPGAGFVERRGFVRSSQAVSRRQHLAEVARDDVAELYAEAASAAAAYELVRVGGRTPEELMPAVAVMTASINDAPLDDLDIEDEVYPPERIRTYEEAQLVNGMRLYRLLARHRETGELAGHTVVAVERERPAIAYQHDTSVVRAHRGHRLGLLLKTAMLQWLADAEPGLETIDTWNTESNDHMISVNEVLGYRWVARELQFMRHLSAG